MKNILLEIDENTYCISDTHFFHKGVIEWEKGRLVDMHSKGFGLYTKTQEEMDEAHNEWVIKNWNDTVNDDSIIIHFGDFAWKGIQYIIPRLKGRKILILGNHDRKGSNSYEGFEYIVRGNIKIENGLIYINEDEDKLMSSLEITINKQKLLLSHYPATVKEHRYKYVEGEISWEVPINKRIDKLIDIAQFSKIDYNIHGHTHSTSHVRSEHGWQFGNVSLEAINFKPIQIKDVIW